MAPPPLIYMGIPVPTYSFHINYIVGDVRYITFYTHCPAIKLDGCLFRCIDTLRGVPNAMASMKYIYDLDAPPNYLREPWCQRWSLIDHFIYSFFVYPITSQYLTFLPKMYTYPQISCHAFASSLHLHRHSQYLRPGARRQRAGCAGTGTATKWTYAKPILGRL